MAANHPRKLLNILAIVVTVLRSVDGPFLRRIVTPELAPDQVIVKGDPAVIPEKEGLVN